MIHRFREFLIENKVLEVYCDCLLNIGEDYTDNDLTDMNWCDIIDCAFGWDDAERYLGRDYHWGTINDKWRELMYEEPAFGSWTGFCTNKDLTDSLLKVNKKQIILNRLKEFMW